jgi:hypothetical protein
MNALKVAQKWSATLWATLMIATNLSSLIDTSTMGQDFSVPFCPPRPSSRYGLRVSTTSRLVKVDKVFKASRAKLDGCVAASLCIGLAQPGPSTLFMPVAVPRACRQFIPLHLPIVPSMADTRLAHILGACHSPSHGVEAARQSFRVLSVYHSPHNEGT